MVQSVISSYMDSLLSKEHYRDHHETWDMLNDCFNLYKTYENPPPGVLLLLDHRYIVINDFQRNDKSDGFIHRKLKLSTDLKSVTGNPLRIMDKGLVIQLYNGYKYFLCWIMEEKQHHPLKTLMDQVSLKMDKSLEIIQRYHDKYALLLKHLDSIDEGISACDTKGQMTYGNKACCDILGIEKDEISNQTRMISPEYKPILAEVLQKKKSIVDQEYFPRCHGKTVHLINSTYPVMDHDHRVMGTIDIFRGIKRTRKLASTLVGQNVSYRFENIIGESRILKETIGLAKSYALSDANIYIQGESGTGKELFAQSIHNYSRRKEEPFIAINCANFPLDLVDSELFGYEEGAFTGAKKGGKTGKFELAHGGTLFLDEIGEMQLHLQAKLLRVLETRTLYRIGGNKPIKIDVKIIAATNRKLYEMVKKGEFREDLYYRLKVLSLEIPPLRERGDDVLVLGSHFIKKIAMEMDKTIDEVDEDGKKILKHYDWPGNVRELENILSRALFICEKDHITKSDLIKAGVPEQKQNRVYKNEIEELNKEILIKTLKKTNGNKKKTAELLGISRPTIYRMMKKYSVKT